MVENRKGVSLKQQRESARERDNWFLLVPFFLKDVFWSIHLESLLQSTQERSKSPPSSLLAQAQKENQDSDSVSVIIKSEEHRKSAPHYKKPQKAFFSFCLWPHPYHTHNLSTTLESFPPFPFLTLPSGSQLAEGSSQTPWDPSCTLADHDALFPFLDIGWSSLPLHSKKGC